VNFAAAPTLNGRHRSEEGTSMSARPNTARSAQAISFLSSGAQEANEARERLVERYGDCDPERADVIVALGGDGLMLQTLHRMMDAPKPIYGMNRGSVGFLMNEFHDRGLRKRLETARLSIVHPLLMRTTDVAGATSTARAINEVSLLRQTYQAAKLRIAVDGKERLGELIADGVLLATPAGSTAYNLSAAPMARRAAAGPRRGVDRRARSGETAGVGGRRSLRDSRGRAGRHRHGPSDVVDAVARSRPFARRANPARAIPLLRMIRWRSRSISSARSFSATAGSS
jgi:hypothetical protein